LDDATTPDSNEHFIASINNLLETVELKTVDADGMKQAVRVVAPFLEQGFKKIDIIRWAFTHLGQDFIENTRSCYRSKPEPCGVCSACIKREEAVKAILKEMDDAQKSDKK
jgi:7-cyano-7-deazaguanine synthase in queuosine biosynthesis